MRTFWKMAPTATALVALALVVYQTVRVRRLTKEVARLKRARPAVKKAGRGSGELAALQRRVYGLEGAVRRLVGLNLAQHGKAGTKLDPVLAAWIKNELKNLRDDVDSVITNDALSSEAGRKRLKKLLRKARREERQERRQRWREVSNALRRERLNRFAEDHDIDGATTKKLDTMLGDERTKLHRIMRSFRDGDKDVGVAIKEARTLMDATDKQARGMLDDDQYKAYLKMRSGSRIARFLRR